MPHIGQRLSFNTHPCTVRYVGPVDGTAGQWIGVEWDDPTRGKHNGIYAGKRYFTCIVNHPTIASFVRPSRPTDPRRSFVAALTTKYVEDTTRAAPATDAVATAAIAAAANTTRPIRISGKVVEEVGFDKVRQRLAHLSSLQIVLLEDLAIGQAKPARCDELVAGIAHTCPSIVELSLASNLLEEWAEVVAICGQLPALQVLRVGSNRFRDVLSRDIDDVQLSASTEFGGLLTLGLDYTMLEWEQICYIANSCPSLRSLSVADNGLHSVNYCSLPSTLTVLVLEGNALESLEDLSDLCTLPNLQRLTLKRNSICRIRSAEPLIERGSPVRPSHLALTSNLTSVDFSYNKINTWSFIDSLPTVFPGMASLRVAHNPLFSSLRHPDRHQLSPEDGYLLVTARLSQLQTLNFSAITEKDRTNAETYYLSLIHSEYSQKAATNDRNSTANALLVKAISINHPRYAALAEKYGRPLVSDERPISTYPAGTLGANLLTLRCRFVHPPSSQKQHSSNGAADVKTDQFELEVPRSFDVYTVLGMLGKRLGIFALHLHLVWETGEWDFAGPGIRPIQEAGIKATRQDRDGSGSDKVADNKTHYDTDNDEDEGWWDSEEEEVECRGGERAKKVPRETVIVHGRRAIGNWVDGDAADLRVEYRPR